MRSRVYAFDEIAKGLEIEALRAADFEDLKQGKIVCYLVQEIGVDDGEGGGRQRRQQSKGKKLTRPKNGLQACFLGF
jgi:hypothetical protein